MTYRKDPSGFEEIICNTDIHDNLQHIIIFNKQPGQEIWQSAHNIAMEIKDTGLPAKKTFEKI